jgi:hypothetical protein
MVNVQENIINENITRKKSYGCENSLSIHYNEMNDKWYCVIRLGYSRHEFKYFDTREELINYVINRYTRVFGKLERIPFKIL